MTIVKTLKALYERLGGTPSDVANATRAVEVLNAIAALYGGASNATHIAKAIANIVAVASGLIKPSGTKSITANGTDIDVTEYAAVDVAVPQPSGTISITENGTGIDVAQYATANVNVTSASDEVAELLITGTMGKPVQNVVVPAYANSLYIREYAFADTLVNSVTFEPYSESWQTRYLRHHAFYNCTAMTTVNLFGFREIGGSAFAGSNIETIYLDENLNKFTKIDGLGAFYHASALTDIYYTGTQQQWEAITGLSDADIPQGCTIHYEYTPTP